MAAADYFMKEPACKVIGPQLGPNFDPCGVRITIAFPHRQDIDALTCRLFSGAAQHAMEPATSSHPFWRHYVFRFTDLVPGQEYSYRFYGANDQPVDLGPGLTEEDCRFLAPRFSAEDKFVLLSCNNPFYSNKPVQQRFAMWDRLLETVTNDPTVKFVVQGGDQVYHDDIAKVRVAPAGVEEIDEAAVISDLIRNYQHFYGWPSFREIMARIPSVAMLDDHDITDGWGGDPDTFDQEGGFKPKWLSYFALAYDAFTAYQTTKNPPGRIHNGVETTFVDFGINRLYLLDLRKEKNIRNEGEPLVSRAHEEKTLESVRQVPEAIRNVFILSPVVPVRINPAREEALAALSEATYALRNKARDELANGKKGINWWLLQFWRAVYWVTRQGDLATLTDDLTDSLSSRKNRRSLIALVTTLANLKRARGVRPYILSGDIHVGGISEILVRNQNGFVAIPQIVSSPIGYEPMHATVKDSTTEEYDFEIAVDQPADASSEDPKVAARNIFYRSDRNFCIIRPGAAEDVPRAEFQFESLKEPIRCSVSFSGND